VPARARAGVPVLYPDGGETPLQDTFHAVSGWAATELISGVDRATEFTMDVFVIDPGGHPAQADGREAERQTCRDRRMTTTSRAPRTEQVVLILQPRCLGADEDVLRRAAARQTA
jgi:hypothetical protein